MCGCLCVLDLCSSLPFYRLKEEGLHTWGISEVVYFPPRTGEEQWAVLTTEHCGAWC